MKVFISSLFVFKIWWSIVIASVEDNAIHSALGLQITHQGTTIKENDLNADEHLTNMTSDAAIHYTQEFFYTEDLKKICHGQVNEFVWKCPTISDTEEKILKFHTINDKNFSSTKIWYLKSINEIDIVEMNPKVYNQIQFYVEIEEKSIFLSRLYPTYPEISGFEILQFLTNLAFQCKFLIHVHDASDVSIVYSTLYSKSYYGYHFKGINLSQNFLFKKIIVKKKTFLDCFEKKPKA